MTKLISWNVNGIRAVQKKGFLEWLERESPDILCVQETKAHPGQLDVFLLNPPGYHVYWNAAEKKGYSGVATFAKKKPLQVKNGFGNPRFDSEGRVIVTEFQEFVLLNIYFPNGGRSPERLKFKLDFYEETLRFVQTLKAKGKKGMISGDYNTAHRPIDLARPEANQNISGFLPEERAWLDRWIAHGQIDIFREFNRDPEQYTWWDVKTGARARNVGWRIDYHFVTQDLAPFVRQATIHPEVMGSDHCPVGVIMKS